MKPNNRKTRTAVAIVSAALLLAAAGGVWSWISTIGAETAQVQTVVDSIDPPASWGDYSGRVTPATPLCMGPSPCPSAFIHWDFDESVAPSELRTLLDSAGLDFEIIGDCVMDDEDDIWPSSVCGASGVNRGVAVDFAVSVDGSTSQTSLIVSIELDKR